MPADAINLLGMPQSALETLFTEIGEKPFHARQLMRWVYQRGITDFDEMTDLSKSLRQKLQEQAVIELPEVLSQHNSTDGTIKWLFESGFGQAVEADLLVALHLLLAGLDVADDDAVLLVEDLVRLLVGDVLAVLDAIQEARHVGLLDLGGRLLLHVGKDVAVRVERDGDGCMSQTLGNDLRMDVRGKHERGRSVPEIMEPKWAQPRPAHESLELR